MVTLADKYAAQVLELVNAERAKEDLPALKASDALNKAANIRAKELVTENSPNRPDGRNGCSVLTDEKIVYETAGENIAGNSSNSGAVKAWMNSSGHKANIFWNLAGYQVSVYGSYQRHYICGQHGYTWIEQSKSARLGAGRRWKGYKHI